MNAKSTHILTGNAGRARAAAILRDGGLVAFPTETVYGLGADATNDAAVAAIFAAKARPHFNPLIVHFTDADGAARQVDFDPRADKLAAAFWPGALTLVLPRAADCALSQLVSAGLTSVAVRVPAHPVAHALIDAAGCPIAAPSANRSGRISSTEAGHVAADLAGRIAAVLDGGPCTVGIESTVIDLTTATATLLRPGGIAAEDIEAVIGPLARAATDDDALKSPGMLARHYAPRLPIRLNATTAAPGEAHIGFGPGACTANLSAECDTVAAATRLFALLHRFDDPAQFSAIAVAPIPETGLGVAINDRLRRAATPTDDWPEDRDPALPRQALETDR